MAKAKHKTDAKRYGVRWIEFDRRTDRMVKKERFFRTDAELDRFIEREAEHPRFYAWDAFLEEEPKVDPEDACPGCGERGQDRLVWQDDGETVRCTACDKTYRPGSPRRISPEADR